ncbi:hypothetical protein K466DRAFT_602166 [Polyporus arcularius HHB13444]|uniref:Uncharacterized protein n=1 Tax=Polyporus arcularius HHB13444 TaxID=1314778 RepID=A0A5C3P3L7_9APHY|nr:hypothetical protein K466DRAFT_602166 [Polyporus arcularius HHB13444]
MTLSHLYMLCAAHGLTMDEIRWEEPLPAASRIMKGWRGGVDLIEIRTDAKDGSPRIEFLLVLVVSPQVRGQKPPVHLLKYKASYADVLPTIFPREAVASSEKYFPGGRLPWLWMPWPHYLYVTPCVRRAMDRYYAIWDEHARARRGASDGAAEGLPPTIPHASATSMDVTHEKQGRLSTDSVSEKERVSGDDGDESDGSVASQYWDAQDCTPFEDEASELQESTSTPDDMTSRNIAVQERSSEQ